MTKLLDIEGTTTSIAFVYEALFPFARNHLAGYLERNWTKDVVQADVAALRVLAARDAEAGLTPPLIAPESADAEAIRTSVVRNVLAQMDSDRKTTPLKSLQGKIWADGYASGELKGHVYDDVLPALQRWNDAGESVYIYSSGSVAAQKLLFGASEAGDLLPLLAGHFDTTSGHKREASSYETIAQAIGQPPGDITFVTDVFEEALAAQDAGLNVVISVRPGNQSLPDGHGFRTVTSFDEIA